MSIGFFTDRQRQPGEAEVAVALGDAKARWDALVANIRAIPKVGEDFRFMYGKNYGWGLRFRLKGKLLTAFYPNDGFFVAQMILSLAQLAEVEEFDLHAGARKALDAATLYAEGKWLFVRVETDGDGADVRRLIGVRGEAWWGLAQNSPLTSS